MSWKSSLLTPFQPTSAHIPDNETNQSGVVRTRTLVTFQPSNGDSSTSAIHNGAIFIWPHPDVGATFAGSFNAGSTNLGDLSATGTAGQPNVHASTPAPNLAALGDQFRVRQVSCGVRIRYEGTELNRSGAYAVGVVPVQYPATTVATTGTVLSPMSALFGDYAAVSYTTALIKQEMKNPEVVRVLDGDLEVRWVPNGIPTYQGGSATQSRMNPFVTSGGASVRESLYATDPGDFGVAYGSNVLAILIENDNVDVAAILGNAYTLEIIQHWEVIPSNPDAVSFPLTPSPSSPMVLADAVNAASHLTSLIRGGTTNSGPPRAKARSKPQNVFDSSKRGVIKVKPKSGFSVGAK